MTDLIRRSDSEAVPAPFVTVISGTSGGGKTTLMERVVELTEDAVRLYFDDYLHLGNDPEKIRQWLEGGADPDWIETPRLAADLSRLRAGETVELPEGLGILRPAGVILVEEPFGRARREIAPLVDLSVHLNLPPDVALARRIVRAVDEREEAGHGLLLREIRNDLKAYLAAGREAYSAAERAARRGADLVFDALRSTDDMARDLVAEIHRRRTDSGTRDRKTKDRKS